MSARRESKGAFPEKHQFNPPEATQEFVAGKRKERTIILCVHCTATNNANIVH